VLKVALGVGLGLRVADLAGAQDSEPRKARPQANDRFVFAHGDRKGQVITLADLLAGGLPLIAFPFDAIAKIVRDDSRLNQVLLVRLDSKDLNTETRARAADGTVVATQRFARTPDAMSGTGCRRRAGSSVRAISPSSISRIARGS
jgi:hypothetical protein